MSSLELHDASGCRRRLDTFRDGRVLVVVVFKTTCPTCRLAWPYLVRLARTHADAMRLLAVSQDGPPATLAFIEDLGGAGPAEVLYDPAPAFEASNALGVESVPHHVVFSGGGNPESLPRRTWFGWSREALEDLARELSRDHGPFPLPLIPADDPVPAFRPG